MESVQNVEHFIAHKQAKPGARGDVTQLMPGTLPFVTVSSQSGAGGHVFTQSLIDLLANESSDRDELRDWRSFDKKMCQQVLEEEHLAEAMTELLHSDYHSQIDEFVMGIFGDRGMQNVAYARLSKVLRTIASLGKVVLLGHGGSLATRSLAGGIHVRLVAPLPIRAVRMASLLEVDEERAARMIHKRDKKQRKLLKAHYRVNSADPVQYDLVCNTERVSPQTAAELVLSLLHKQIS